MIFPPYLGSPITDYSGEGGIIPTCFYLVSFFNKPYRVIYTRYPYNYLKRLIRRFMRGKVKGLSSLCFRDVVNALVILFRNGFILIQLVFSLSM